MSYIVYCHENIFNKKRYVGITCKSLSKRSGANGQRYEECPHFFAAIQKYGWNNFNHYILFEGLQKDEACEKEKYLIEIWNLTDPEYGYNISKGGDGLTPEVMKKKWENPEYRSVMCSKMKEAWTDPVKRNARSELTKVRWQDEGFQAKVKTSIKHACGKHVLCLETGEVFETIKEASFSIGVSDKNAKRAIKKGYLWGGFHWTYVDNVS